MPAGIIILIPIPNQTTENSIIKDTRNHFRVKEKNNDIYDKIVRDIGTLFESDEENYFSSKYIEHKSNNDKDKKLSIEEYLDKIKPYLITYK